MFHGSAPEGSRGLVNVLLERFCRTDAPPLSPGTMSRVNSRNNDQMA
jgi:hypothetical protein